jgi:DNA-binding NtrC family response regulator
MHGSHVSADGAAFVHHELRVLVVDGPSRGARFETRRSHAPIGSGAGSDVVLEDSAVSRRHCEISVRGEGYVIRDLSSTNGTRVDGTSVIEAPLAPGSRIEVGRSALLFKPTAMWERLLASEEDGLGRLRGRSQAMRELFGTLSRLAPSDLSVLLTGETGTGKELVARTLHAASARAEGPFVVVDCSTLDAERAPSELFGHEVGAFTGAHRARTGALELASSGTLLLDEVGELANDVQKQLLGALERREVKRLGGSEPRSIDFRLVATTHRSLEQMVERGSFRPDLFFRLAEVTVELPPLRERLEDLPSLVVALLEDERHGGASPLGTIRVDPSAIALLAEHAWPGNVRELRNVLMRTAALAGAGAITSEHLREAGFEPRDAVGGALVDMERLGGLTIKEARESATHPVERRYLAQLMERHRGDVDSAARQAGLHRKSLLRLLRRHQLGDGAGPLDSED